MDWISITTGCFALSNAIGKTSSSLNAFVRDVRESRAELETLSGELHSLDGVLDLLRDDASSFPPTLAARTPTVLQHCTAVINELEGYVMVLNSNELSTQAKRLRWAATKSHMAKLRLTLDGYKSTIGLALDLVAFTSAAGRDSGRSSPTEAASASKNISKTVEEMGRLSARLQGDFQKNAALRSYLDALQLYAESTGVNLEPDHAASSMKSVSDAPDSAIDMNDDAAFKSEPPTPDLALRTEDLDELLDELREMPSNNTNRDRPPTPPPRNMRRSLSVSSVAPPPIAISRPSLTLRPTDYTFVTTITAGGNDSASPPPAIKRGFLGRMFSTSSKKRTMSSSSAASIKTVDSRPSTAASTAPSIAVVPSNGSSGTERPVGGLVRRGSRRMSTSIKSLPQMFKVAEDPAAEADTEPNAVFGVSLQKSLQVAHGSAKTRHTTGGGSSSSSSSSKKTASGSTSHRDFPLCVHKCVQFITHGTDEGVAVPDIFGEPGDARRLAALRRLFSEGPRYGDDVDWEWFTVYEAADLILCYLSELPKPLVPESVAKRWISLSRQATVSNGSRTDQCLDFWEEALLGVRPGPPRNLLKLLLNLWADVAEAADHNGMTAERLAGRVVQPLMHTSARTYTTDYMLGLAFLIRKRSEYLALMQGNKGKAKAAF